MNPTPNLNSTLAALGDKTRRSLLERLGDAELRVTDLAAPFGISLNAVSKHLRVLERAGLVRRRRVGREHLITLDRGPLEAAALWIEQQRNPWTSRLDDLDALFAAEQSVPPIPRP